MIRPGLLHLHLLCNPASRAPTPPPPSQDPLAIIGVVSILLPFVLLGVAIATGVIDTSVYQ